MNKQEIINQELRNEIDQLRFDMENKPEFKKGDILKDGTLITAIIKINLPTDNYIYSNTLFNPKFVQVGAKEYYWSYEGVKDGEIIQFYAAPEVPEKP